EIDDGGTTLSQCQDAGVHRLRSGKNAGEIETPVSRCRPAMEGKAAQLRRNIEVRIGAGGQYDHLLAARTQVLHFLAKVCNGKRKAGGRTGGNAVPNMIADEGVVRSGLKIGCPHADVD